MAVTFDFQNGVDGSTLQYFSTPAQSISYTDEGVTFTLSATAIDGFGIGRFFGAFFATSAAGFEMDDANGNDVFQLSFTPLTGNATSPLTMVVGGTIVGSWIIQPQTIGGAAFGAGVAVNSLSAPGFNISFTSVPDGVAVGGIQFTASSPGRDILGIESLSINCFTAGTEIATPEGRVAVEDLREGEMVLTAEGHATQVIWLGRQEVPARFLHPATINPICITAGALGNNLPERDLRVSPDHGIGIDGLLINARALVNGSTIFQVADMPLDGFTYYHVETGAHELLLAEGCAAESYLDIPDRSAFVNGAERHGALPVKEMDLLRIPSKRLLPESLRTRLALRAGQMNRRSCAA